MSPHNNGQFFQFMDSNGDGTGNTNMNLDYSAFFVLYGLIPTCRVRVHRIIHYCEMPNPPVTQIGTFMNLPILARGFLTAIARGLAPLQLLTDGFVIQNKGFRRFGQPMEFRDDLGANQWIAMERTYFPGKDNALYIDPSDGLWVFLNEDYTSFSKQRICLECSFEDGHS